MVKLPAVRNYVLRLPAINYTLPTFASCFAPFVEYYQQESKRYYFSNFPTQEAIEECLKWLTPLQPLIQPSHLTPHPSYIMGSTLSADTEKILYYLLDGTLTATSQNKDPQLYDQIYYDTQIEKLCIVQVPQHAYPRNEPMRWPHALTNPPAGVTMPFRTPSSREPSSTITRSSRDPRLLIS
jgi:hypothetical protein